MRLVRFLKKLLGRGLFAAWDKAADVRWARLALRGTFRCRIFAPDGVTVVDDFVVANAATTVGLNYLLDGSFRAGTQITAWYIGLINGSGFSAVSAGDTMSSHAGWTELTVYSEATRQQWSPGAASGGVLVNASPVVFTNGGATASIQGMFLTSSSTKSGTTGTLYSTAVEGSPRSLAASSPFQVYYQVDLTPVS